MPSGKKANYKVEPARATSIFDGVRNSNVDIGGFGKATSGISGRAINTTYTQDPQWEGILSGAKQGIAANQSIFNLTPEQQLSQVESNPYYLYAAENNRRVQDAERAKVNAQNARSGLTNSTMAGAMQASLADTAAQQDLQARLGSIETMRAMAGENLGYNQDIADQIWQYAAYPTDLAANTMMQAGQQQDQVAMLNAQMQQQANLYNAQQQQINDQINRQRSLSYNLSRVNPLVGFATGNYDAAGDGLLRAEQMIMAAVGMGGGGGMPMPQQTPAPAPQMPQQFSYRMAS